MRIENKQTLALAFLAIILWSTVATAFKLGLNYFSPIELVFYACITSFIVLVFLAYLKHGKELLNGVNSGQYILNSALQGALNPFLYYIVLFAAYQKLPAQVAQPVNFTWPIFLSVFAVIFLKEKFSTRTFPALLVSFAGVIVVSAQGNFSIDTFRTSKLGILLGLLSAIIWSVYWIINIKDNRPALIKLSWSFFFGTSYIVLYSLLADKLQSKLEIQNIIYPFYLSPFHHFLHQHIQQ